MNSPAEDLALLGTVKETVVVLGKKFILKTLDADQESTAKSSSSIFDLETRREVLKMEKLARSIETIDGVPFTLSKDEADRGMTVLQKARDVIYKWQGPVVDRVYVELLKLEAKREAVLREIEKNASSPVIPSGAGR